MFLVLAYCTFLSHPIALFAGEIGATVAGSGAAHGTTVHKIRSEAQQTAAEPEVAGDLHIARSFILLGTVLHFVTICASFVHRDYNCFKRSPLTNLCWVSVVALLLLVHLAVLVVQLCTDDYLWQQMERIWPVAVYILLMTLVTFCASEFFKWEEIKVNNRYILRARLDFGTKLGMNSPF